MFNKLFRNIYLPIVIIAVILMLFIDIFSIIMLTDTMKTAYSANGQKKVTRALDSCRLYVSSAAASTYNLSLDGEIIRELAAPTGKTLVDKLDSTCNYSLKINAVCVYSANGRVYTSSEVAQVPSFEELKKIDEIKSFIEGNEWSAISLRNECVAEIYHNVTYPKEMGVITCCQKVYDGDKTVGWIFTDILPSNLYNTIVSGGQFENAVAFIEADGIFFEYGGNEGYAELLQGKARGYFRYSATADDGLFTVTVFDGTGDYSARAAVISSVMIAASLILLTGVHFVAKYIAQNVTYRLEKLSAKMNSQKLP